MELTEDNTLVEIDVAYSDLHQGDHIAAVAIDNGKETQKHGVYLGRRVMDVTDVSRPQEVDLFEFKGDCILYRIHYSPTLSESPMQVVQRAKNLLLDADCFKDFDWALNTCECVVVFCKTGKLMIPPKQDWEKLLKFVHVAASASSLLATAGAKASGSK